MHHWKPIPGFEARPFRFGMVSACHCRICGSRRMVWRDGTHTIHYASPSQYLGAQEPECVEAEIIESVPFTLQSNQPMTTATIQLIEQRAQAMIGRTFVFKQDDTVHTIQEYVLRDHRLIITSDQRRFNFEAKHALRLMEQFSEVPESVAKSKADEIFEGVEAMASGQAPVRPYAQEVPDVHEVQYPTESTLLPENTGSNQFVISERDPSTPGPNAVANEGLKQAFAEFSEQVVEKADKLKRDFRISAAKQCEAITQKAQAMAGTSFVFKMDGFVHNIKEFKLEKGKFYLKTSLKEFDVDDALALALLDEFLPVTPENLDTYNKIRDELMGNDFDIGMDVIKKNIEEKYGLKLPSKERTITDRPWPIALYQMLTPIVSDYEKAMDNVRHYRDAHSLNNPIYLHKDAGAVDTETAEAIYTLAIDRAQQELQDTEKEFRQVIVDFISITR